MRIDGFDLGNAPRDYSRQAVAGRRIVTTTTNGTAAVAACPLAEVILMGALVNRRAVAARGIELALAGGGAPRPIHLVCAGTDGAVTEEDILAAGAILEAAGATRLDAAAIAARERFRETIRGATDPRIPLAAALADSRGGRNLLAIGMAADIGDAAAIDTIPVVPRLDRGTGWFHVDRLRPAIDGRPRPEAFAAGFSRSPTPRLPWTPSRPRHYTAGPLSPSPDPPGFPWTSPPTSRGWTRSCRSPSAADSFSNRARSTAA